MKEHPLIFSAPMVRAILEGRKSVTRRLADYSKWKKGDTVWVKEALAIGPARFIDPDHEDVDGVVYRADGTLHHDGIWCWKRNVLAGQFCPKSLSRITLELTEDVRREPLSVCSAVELQREGFMDGDLHSFAALWDQMHPDQPWASNPIVSVIEFKVIAP